MATMTEMLNDGRTTRTVLAQMLAARYAQRIEAETHRFVPAERFDEIKRITGEVLSILAQGCPFVELIDANRGHRPEVVAIIEFARDGGIDAAHKRATEAA